MIRDFIGTLIMVIVVGFLFWIGDYFFGISPDTGEVILTATISLIVLFWIAWLTGILDDKSDSNV